MINSIVLISLLGIRLRVQSDKHEVPAPHSNKAYIHTTLQWFESCTRNKHPECDRYRKQRNQRLSRPRRLLYYPSYQTEKAQLVEVQMGQVHQYATLSHRWGTPEPPKLSFNSDGHRKISYSTMVKGVSTSDLPRIFREALQIIHHCKLEYLWIDSLCINQDNDNDGGKREWEQEAVKIGDIYAGGVFNIAAIGSKSSDGTLFPEHREFFTPVVRDSFDPDGQYGKESRTVGVLPNSDEEFERQVLSSELLSRGWVYQEVILAPANLFCTAQQMWWLCHTGRYCQNQSWTIPQAKASSNADGDTASLSKGREAIANSRGIPGSLRLWGELLRLYSKTSVSFKDDRLAAIAGLSRVFQSVFPQCVEGGSYNSEVWSTNIIFQLSWHTTPSNIAPNRYRADHFIPSWSPISCKGEITYPWNQLTLPLPIKCTMSSSGLDSFGRAESIHQCILHLRGVPIEMTLGPMRDTTGVWPSLHPNAKYEVLCDNQAEIDLAKKASLENELRALILTTVELPWSFYFEGILLRPFRDKDLTAPDKWVRCGYFKDLRSPQPGYTDICKAFQLTRYGIRWVKAGRGCPKRVSTGLAPDLEDIYLV